MRFDHRISIFASEAIPVDRVDIKVVSFEFIVFFVVLDEVLDIMLREIAALIDGSFGEIRFYHMHFA